MIRSLALLAALLGGSTAAPAAGGDPLAAYRWKARILVVAAADAGDPRLAAQRAVAAQARAGFDERDLVVVEAVGTGADTMRLRRRLALSEREFRVVLIGKDGEAKLTEGEPVAAERLFAVVDVMPMRQEERRRR